MQEFDVLVVGAGAAGLRAAIAAKQAGATVALLTKVHPLRTNTGLAQGGINAPLGADDSPEAYAGDILQAGDGLCDPAVVQTFTQQAGDAVMWLERMGVPFNRGAEGRFDRRQFGSNGKARSLYVDDRTGHVVMQVLYEQFQRARIPLFADWFVTSLAMDSARCVGVTALGLRSGVLDSFGARAVILATGGFTRLFLPSTVSIGTTGDGQNLAYQAGVALKDLEMVPVPSAGLSGRQCTDDHRGRAGGGRASSDGRGSADPEPDRRHPRQDLHGDPAGAAKWRLRRRARPDSDRRGISCIRAFPRPTN